MDPCNAGVIDAAAGISNGLDVFASPERADVEGGRRPADAGRLQAPIPNVFFWRMADDLVR
jgi:hypothetical protein